MGNDGGSIPTRRELVKEAARALSTTQVKEVRAEQQAYAWSHDPLTRKPLARPVVSDAAGVLYNKDSIIEFLLKEEGDAERKEMDKVMEGRVKGLKDVVEVKFDIGEGEAEGTDGTGRKEKWVCSVSGRELGPGSRAAYIVPCGHAFAGTVVKEVQGETCLQCNEPYASNDIIPILPTLDTDIARLSLRLKTLKEKGLTHALKKAPGIRKRKKHAEKAVPDNATTAQDASSTAKDASPSEEKNQEQNQKKERKAAPTNGANGTNGAAINIKNSSTASLTKKVLEEQEERNKRRKLMQNDNVKSLFSSRSEKPNSGNSADYMTRGFSIGNK